VLQGFLATYVKGGLELVQRLMPSFQESGAGRVVFIGSEAVQSPRKHWAHYVTAKSAYLGLMRALSVELAEFGATVNLVSPGLLHTSDVLPDNVKTLTRNATPLKRLASEEEVAEVVLFLLEKGGSFISGSDIPLSGARVFS
jgi:3-oxoacyl-[acyl-carrier protein] reductase